MFDFRLAGKHYTNVSSFFPFSSNTQIVSSIYIDIYFVYSLLFMYFLWKKSKVRKFFEFLKYYKTEFLKNYKN